MYRKSLMYGIGWIVAICLFLSCSDEKTDGPQPLGVTFPEAVQAALDHYFPDQVPSSAEELNDEASGALRYLVTYGTDACILVDAEGEWQFVECTESPLPEVLQEEYAGQFQTIAQEYPNDEPISLQQAAYGVTMGLMNGELLAFEENSGTLLGNELMGYEGKAEAIEILPTITGITSGQIKVAESREEVKRSGSGRTGGGFPIADRFVNGNALSLKAAQGVALLMSERGTRCKQKACG